MESYRPCRRPLFGELFAIAYILMPYMLMAYIVMPYVVMAAAAGFRAVRRAVEGLWRHEMAVDVSKG